MSGIGCYGDDFEDRYKFNLLMNQDNDDEYRHCDVCSEYIYNYFDDLCERCERLKAMED